MRRHELLLATVVILSCLAAPASAIRIGEEDRQTLAGFAAANDLSETQMQTLFGATLQIICPWGGGTGAMVSHDGVFVTAAHVVFGGGQETFRACRAQSLFGGPWLQLHPEQYFKGSDFLPNTGNSDIFVGRLVGDVRHINPFRIDRSAVGVGEQVYALAFGQDNWKGDAKHPVPSIGLCSILEATEREVASDCDADSGSSGGPLLRFPLARGSPATLLGITVSFTTGEDRTADCDDTHECHAIHLRIHADIIDRIDELDSR